ncbi:MAG: DUF2149 domain-containing protein [Candidatus Brocadiales bacterium]
MRKLLKPRKGREGFFEEEPLSGVANLFDVSVVFIVALVLALFTVYGMQDFLSPTSEFTVVKTNTKGEKEIIVKKGKKIEAYKISGRSMSGQGERLGTAYRLDNGQIIYVPEEEAFDE